MTPEQFRKIAEPLLSAIRGRGTGDADRVEKLKAAYRLGKLLVNHVPKHSTYGDKQNDQVRQGPWMLQRQAIDDTKVCRYV